MKGTLQGALFSALRIPLPTTFQTTFMYILEILECQEIFGNLYETWKNFNF